MKTADIVVGETYALATHQYQMESRRGKRMADKVIVKEISVERRFYTGRSRHAQTSNNGILVEFGTGRTEVVTARAIQMPWDVYEAEEKANVEFYIERSAASLEQAQKIASSIAELLGGEEVRDRLLPYGYDARVHTDGSYSSIHAGTKISPVQLNELLKLAYEQGRQAGPA